MTSKYSLPPLPEGEDSSFGPYSVYISEQMQAYAIAAIEANRQHNKSTDKARSSRSVNQIKEALQDRSQRFVASRSEVENLINFYEAHDHDQCVPLSTDGNSVFIDGIGEVPLDFSGQARGEPIYLVQHHLEKNRWQITTEERVVYLKENAAPGHWEFMTLYTAPQPQQIPPERPYPDTYLVASWHEAKGWNDCRSTMLKATLQQAKSVNSTHIPEGYALVPIEPTPEMLKSGWAENDVPLSVRWKAMIKAAPEVKPHED